MIPDERAQRQGGYLQDGKEIVLFDPPLTVEEWEHLMKCQEIATPAFEKEATKEAKKNGKEKNEQTEESEDDETSTED